VQFSEGREICRVRYVSRENEENAGAAVWKLQIVTRRLAGHGREMQPASQSETRYTLTWFP